MSYLRELWGARELVVNLTLRDIKGQYKRTIFGQLWSLVNPLALMLVYSVVFGFFLRIAPPPGDPSGLDVFPLWLLTGLLPWIFFSTLITQGMGSLVGNASLIQKVYFPRMTLPLALIGALGYNFLIEMAVLVVALAIAGSKAILFFPFAILVMVIFSAFSAGLVMMLSVANVHFRDTQHFVGILLMVWMYLSPIVYPASLVQDQLTQVSVFSINLFDVYMLNPIARFVEVFRNLLYDNRLPSLDNVLYILVISGLVLVAGFFVFRANEKGLAEAL